MKLIILTLMFALVLSGCGHSDVPSGGPAPDSKKQTVTVEVEVEVWPGGEFSYVADDITAQIAKKLGKK
jgi:uncharacterized protein YceK